MNVESRSRIILTGKIEVLGEKLPVFLVHHKFHMIVCVVMRDENADNAGFHSASRCDVRCYRHTPYLIVLKDWSMVMRDKCWQHFPRCLESSGM
jgi:hypothetical protein